MNLLIDKNAFDKFLLGKQEKLEQDQLLESKLKHQSCMNLKNAFETSINDMITNNKSESITRFVTSKCVNVKYCELDADVKELDNIVSKKTGFMLNVSTNYIQPYFFHDTEKNEADLKIVLLPK